MEWDHVYDRLLMHPYRGEFAGVLGESRLRRSEPLTIERDGAESIFHVMSSFQFGFYGKGKQAVDDHRYALYVIDIGSRVTRLQVAYLIEAAVELFHDVTTLDPHHPKKLDAALRSFGCLPKTERKAHSCDAPPNRKRRDLIDIFREHTV